MKIPLNQEHHEANQTAADQRRNEIKESMTERDKAIMDALEKASADLNKKDISFFLLGKTKDHELPYYWVFHSLLPISKQNDVYNPDNNKEYRVNFSLLCQSIDMFIRTNTNNKFGIVLLENGEEK